MNHVAMTAKMVITNRMVNAVGTLNFFFFFGGASTVAVAVAAVASADMNSSLWCLRRRACSGGFLSSLSVSRSFHRLM